MKRSKTWIRGLGSWKFRLPEINPTYTIWLIVWFQGLRPNIEVCHVGDNILKTFAYHYILCHWVSPSKDIDSQYCSHKSDPSVVKTLKCSDFMRIQPKGFAGNSNFESVAKRLFWPGIEADFTLFSPSTICFVKNKSLLQFLIWVACAANSVVCEIWSLTWLDTVDFVNHWNLSVFMGNI